MNYARCMAWLEALVISRILAELNRQGLTQQNFAAHVEMPMSVLESKLTRNGVLNVDDIEMFAKALGVPVAELVSEVESHQSQ